MADFCNTCSREHFFEDFGDLRGLTPEIVWNDGRACITICDGYGPIQIDPEGNCVSKDCDRAGKPGHGLEWKK